MNRVEDEISVPFEYSAPFYSDTRSDVVHVRLRPIFFGNIAFSPMRFHPFVSMLGTHSGHDSMQATVLTQSSSMRI